MSLIQKAARPLAAPVVALTFSLLVTSIILLASGHQPLAALGQMVDYAAQPNTFVLMLNQAAIYYIVAIAVALGFRMNLFNIGVDGQYRMGAMAGAVVGGAISLPGPLHVLVIIATSMIVGALWAGIAVLLKIFRGVSEIISTIMLNYVATGVIAYFLQTGRLAVSIQGSNNIGTPPIPDSGHVPGIPFPGSHTPIFGLALVAIVLGVGYWFAVNKTVFGFELRATGTSEPAAVVSGVNVKRMAVAVMLVSGAVAGFSGLPQLLGASYTYSLDFPAGVAFTAIAIAILGRNHPIGIAFSALLFAFLTSASQVLELNDVPKEVANIAQGVIVLSVVIAYELARRRSVVRERQTVSKRMRVQSATSQAGAIS